VLLTPLYRRATENNRVHVSNSLGWYHYFGEMGASPKQLGFGEVAPTLGRAGFFSGIRLTRDGLRQKIKFQLWLRLYIILRLHSGGPFLSTLPLWSLMADVRSARLQLAETNAKPGG
jgi:hypothetical protein